MGSFTYFVNLFDIMSTPELVFGFRLSIIPLTLSPVTDQNFKLQLGLAGIYCSKSAIGFAFNSPVSPILTKNSLKASAICFESKIKFPFANLNS